MSDDLDYSQLDPNIRQVVRFLRSRGFETTDSGDGRWKWRCEGCGALPGDRHAGGIACGRLAGKLCRREQKGLGVALAIPHVFCHVEHTDQLVTEARAHDARAGRGRREVRGERGVGDRDSDGA
jgi:hypothetical protein